MPFTDIPLIEIILGSFAFIVILAFSLAVYFKNPKSHTNVLFFILAIILNSYIISTAFALHPIIKTLENQLFWIRMDMFIGSFIAPVLFLLAHTFPKNKITLAKKYLIPTVFYTAIMAITSFTYLIFQSVGYPNGSTTPVPVPGPGMIFYFIHIVGYFAASFIVLIKNYKKSTGQDKVKTTYFLIGIIVTFTLMAIFNFLLVLLGYTGLVFLGPIFPVVLMTLVGIAIVKHQFLDIKPLIARAVAYTLLTILMAGIYFLLVFFGLSKFLGLNLNISILLINSSLGVIIALTFQPLRNLLIKSTNKIFFKKSYNAEKILSDLSHTISNTINFNDLANNLLETIVKDLSVSSSAIVLISNNQITDARSIGYTSSKLLDDVNLFKFLNEAKKQNKHFFILSELEDRQKELFRTHDIEVMFPIKVKNEYIAILVLGTKLSGLPYSNQDLSLLDVFASESGISIQNAKLYSDLKKALDSKTRFINVVSHQLRTPVSGIRWSLEELRQGGDVEHQRELVNISHQKVVFLNEQLDDILIALDIYDKKISLNKVPCDILDICKNILEDFKGQLNANALSMIYDISENARLIEADFNKLKKILEVLIKNAVLYSNHNGTIKVSSVTISKRSKNIIQILISDEGLGISPIEKNHMFEEFYRGERAKLKVPDGLGLGMFIAKTFAESHGGSITINSQGAEKGSVITLSLPIN